MYPDAPIESTPPLLPLHITQNDENELLEIDVDSDDDDGWESEMQPPLPSQNMIASNVMFVMVVYPLLVEWK